MANTKSIYEGTVITSQSTATEINSRYNGGDVTSKSDLNIVSIARKAAGASEILALAGAFSACSVGTDWKHAKESYLKERL